MKSHYTCQDKQKARQDTIIDEYRRRTGLTQIPKDRQYWTLCGPLSLDGASLLLGCELDQIEQSGLLHGNHQFHGVEMKPLIHERNASMTRKLPAHRRPHLYGDPLQDVLNEATLDGNFNPAIINLDTVSEPKKAIEIFEQVLDLVNEVSGSVLVVLNVILTQHQWGHAFTLEDIVMEAAVSSYCLNRLKEGWVEPRTGYPYRSEKQGAALMGTLCYYRPFRAAARKVA